MGRPGDGGRGEQGEGSSLEQVGDGRGAGAGESSLEQAGEGRGAGGGESSLEPAGRKGAHRAVFRSNDLIRRNMAQSSGEASLPGWREDAGGWGEDSLAELLLCEGLRPGPQEPAEPPLLGLLVQDLE